MAGKVSGASVRVEIDDSDVRKGLNASVEGARTAMSEALLDVGSLLVGSMRVAIESHNKVDTGGLRDSIAFVIAGRRGLQTLTVGPDEAHAAQAAAIEYGRAAGSRMPPSGALLPWMERHGIAPELEFVVRRAIAERGWRPFPFAGPALSEQRAALDEAFSHVLDVVEAAWKKG